MKNLISQKAMILANQLRRHDSELSLSESLRYAWMVVKAEAEAVVLTFINAAKQVCKRLVSKNITKYYQPNGNGRKPKEGQQLFVDLAKVECGLPCIISTYNVVSIA